MKGVLRIIYAIALMCIAPQGIFGDKNPLISSKNEAQIRELEENAFSQLTSGNPDSAFFCAKQAFYLAKEILDTAEQAYYADYAAYISLYANYPKSTIEFSDAALTYYRPQEKTATEHINCLRKKIRAYQQMGDLYRAEFYLSQAIKTSSKYNLPISVLQMDLAAAYKIMGRSQAALDLYEEVLKEDTLLEFDLFLVCKGSITSIYIDLADLPMAAKEFKPIAVALNQNKVLNRNFIADYYKLWSDIEYLKGNYLKSKDYIEKALVHSPQFNERSLLMLKTDLAKILGRIGKYTEALKIAKNVKTTLRQKTESELDPYVLVSAKISADIYASLGRSDKKYLDSALLMLNEVQEAGNQLRNQLTIQESKINLATYLMKSNQLGLDISVGKYFDNPTEANLNQVLSYMEADKNRVLQDEIKEQILGSRINRQLQERIIDIKMALTEVKNPDLKIKLENQYLASIDSLKKKVSHIWVVNKKKENVKELQRSLTPDNLIIEYAEGERNIYSLTICHTSAKLKTLTVSKDSLKFLTLNYCNNIQQKKIVLSEFVKASYTLRTIVLDKDFAATSLVIISSPSLFQLPFASLVMSPERCLSYKSLDYLIKNRELKYAYSCSQLNNKRETEVKSKIAAIVLRDDIEGDLSGHSSFLKEHIASHNGVLIEESEIDLDQISKECGIIHLSSHGTYLANNAANSYIKLPLRKKLTLAKLYATSLHNNPLIVLNSCETGKGDLMQGEGVSNFTRAFNYCGAGSVIESSWKVNAQTTSAIFRRFYGNLDSLSSSVSLSRSMQGYIQSDETDNELANPYYWAGFKHVGNAVKLTPSRDSSQFLILGLFLTLLAAFIIIRKI